jgi:hypothetical protein
MIVSTPPYSFCLTRSLLILPYTFLTRFASDYFALHIPYAFCLTHSLHILPYTFPTHFALHIPYTFCLKHSLHILPYSRLTHFWGLLVLRRRRVQRLPA